MQFVFDDCVLDTDAHTLTREGSAKPIEPQVFDLLYLLVRHAGELVTKDRMIAEIWGGRIVSESAISARIAAARKAVGDDGKQQMAQSGWNTPGSAFMTGYLSVYFPDAPPDMWANWAQMIQSSCPVENEVRGRSFVNNHSIAAELNLIQAPALVIHSRDDAVHPLSEGQKMARGIPDAELLIMESRNHITLHSDPRWEQMIEAMHAFPLR